MSIPNKFNRLGISTENFSVEIVVRYNHKQGLSAAFGAGSFNKIFDPNLQDEYDLDIIWGDGTEVTYDKNWISNNETDPIGQGTPSHEYSDEDAEEYKLYLIIRKCPQFIMNNVSDPLEDDIPLLICIRELNVLTNICPWDNLGTKAFRVGDMSNYDTLTLRGPFLPPSFTNAQELFYNRTVDLTENNNFWIDPETNNPINIINFQRMFYNSFYNEENSIILPNFWESYTDTSLTSFTNNLVQDCFYRAIAGNNVNDANKNNWLQTHQISFGSTQFSLSKIYSLWPLMNGCSLYLYSSVGVYSREYRWEAPDDSTDIVTNFGIKTLDGSSGQFYYFVILDTFAYPFEVTTAQKSTLSDMIDAVNNWYNEVANKNVFYGQITLTTEF